MSNPILNKIISDLYFHRKQYGYKGYIPIDTYQWHETFEGMGPSMKVHRNDLYIKNKYIDVLNTAKENFQNYTWKLEVNDEIDQGPNRVFLFYELRPEYQI
jgi:hypothetical protein